MGVRVSLTRSSTATKHLIRGCRRRSCPQLGLNISGSNGGGPRPASATCAGGSVAALVELARLRGRAELPSLISRIAASSASSRPRAGLRDRPAIAFRGSGPGLDRTGFPSSPFPVAALGFELLIEIALPLVLANESRFQLEPQVTSPQDDRSHLQLFSWKLLPGRAATKDSFNPAVPGLGSSYRQQSLLLPPLRIGIQTRTGIRGGTGPPLATPSGR